MDTLIKILEKDAIQVNKKVKLNPLLGKHIIITGASGLIGINLLMSIKEFCKNKKSSRLPKVTAVFHNDVPLYLKKILAFKNLIIKKGDITDIAFVNSLKEADFIIHAAGYGQPGKFMQDKVKTIAINTTATISLLKKLKDAGQFLFISSSEIYSGLSKSPFKENQIGTTNTDHPRSCYIEGKRCGEAICNIYSGMGRNVKSARLSLAYGPGARRGDMRVLNSFIEKGLQGEIKMMDRGTAKRTYCYISDTVEMIWDILLFGEKPIYNVGGFSTTTIGSLGKQIGKELDVKVTMPKKDEKLIGAPEDVRLDMSKVTKEFKKSKKDYVSLGDGLKNTIEWHREIYKL